MVRPIEDTSARSVRTWRQRSSSAAPLVGLLIIVIPFILILSSIFLESVQLDANYQISENGILLQEVSNAGKHLFPYLATLITITLLIAGIFYLVCFGGNIGAKEEPQ